MIVCKANKFVFPILLVTAFTGCGNPADPGTAETAVEIVSVVDLGVVEQDARLRGRDGGYSGVLDQKQIWVFGDSVIESPNSDGNTWLSSSFSTTTDLYAVDGLDVLNLENDTAGLPIELFEYTESEAQYISVHRGENCLDPCGARWALWPGPVVQDVARQRSILFYGKVNAEPGEFNFYSVGQSVAVWGYDAPRPTRQRFNVIPDYPTLLFNADEPQFGPGAFSHNDYLYVYACDREGLIKPCKLARVRLSTVTDKSTWEYFSNNNTWASNNRTMKKLFHGNDIMSTSFNRYLRKFVAVYSEPLSRNIKLRTAVSPEGPWSRPLQITNTLSSSNGNGWVYDGLAHAELEEDEGRIVYITYTRDNGNGQREIRLVRVELLDWNSSQP